MELMKKKGYAVLDHDLIKTPAQIEKIKESCKINIAVLDYVAEHIGPGVTTQQIDDWVHEETVRHGGIPLSTREYADPCCNAQRRLLWAEENRWAVPLFLI